MATYVHKRQMRRQHVPHNTHVQMKQGTHTLWFTRTNEAWNTYIVRVFILGEGKVQTAAHVCMYTLVHTHTHTHTTSSGCSSNHCCSSISSSVISFLSSSLKSTPLFFNRRGPSRPMSRAPTGAAMIISNIATVCTCSERYTVNCMSHQILFSPFSNVHGGKGRGGIFSHWQILC